MLVLQRKEIVGLTLALVFMFQVSNIQWSCSNFYTFLAISVMHFECVYVMEYFSNVLSKTQLLKCCAVVI